MVGRCLIIYFISKHAHVHSDLISVAEIKYRFYIYRIYFWTAEEAYCMKITCPLHLPVQCHSSEYNPPMLWHCTDTVSVCNCAAVQHVPTVEYMSPWPSLHVQTWRYGCPRASLRWPVAGGGLEQIVTTALGLWCCRGDALLFYFSLDAGRRRWFTQKIAILADFSWF